ncbi:LamG domain-containing protein [Mangrovimicrobium sediminis]|uniref:LamG domain-containing protein n=1 Tax=Mangrovimicrobium sediminis TaxID=2562682 RepID=A0A4Z0M8A8_9GAMM|nr:LamG domain-containing protein [Haliea sp. SAOS-164]TGD75626.1 LamG domain-containing protein [Haliea sp. SAOS-164]
MLRAIAVTSLNLFLLAACSAGSGGGGSEREVDTSNPSEGGEFVYSGPPPASDEIQSFKINFYDPLAANNRCGECHTPGGSGTTAFVDQGNVNEAWQAARTVVNLNDPAASAVVTRVANGHNCWLGAGQEEACATTLTGYVERWAADSVQSAAVVQLSPRRRLAPGGARVTPATLDEALVLMPNLQSGGELMGLLGEFCAGCHAEDAPVPQVPFFASSDATLAYAALRDKINLSRPQDSRVVLRLFPELHNCWSDCEANAGAMQAAVQRFADTIEPTEVDPALVTSMAQVLEADGIVATSGGRYETDLVAKWEFREGSGATVADTSGVLPEIPLALSGDYSWMASWGIRFVNGKAQGGVTGSGKLFEQIGGTGEYSLEVWVAPANVSQEEAWIAGYSGGEQNSNLVLRQSLYNYEVFARSSVTEQSSAGEPALVTDDDAEFAQATLQHVVVSFDPVEGRRIYVNGQFTGDVDPAGGGLLNNWNEAFAFVLGNSTAGSNPWAGALRMAAVYNRALTPSQVLQNFEVGVGQKYFLLFSVSDLVSDGACSGTRNGEAVDYCYVAFEVSQFDDTSYLFDEPFFANLNPDGGDVDFDLRGIRVGVNGRLAAVGQAFVNVDTRVSGGNLGAQPQVLANIGTILPLEFGAEQDQFFLAFDSIAGTSGAADDGEVQSFAPVFSGAPAPDVAMRTFDEVNATLSALTGVPTGSSVASQVTGKTVAETYAAVRRALPGIADFNAFMSSHQMAATQLAAAYCDALVQSPSLRSAVFPAGFNFNAPVADPGIDWRNQVAAPLVDRAANTGLLDAADRARILDEVELLITDDRDLAPYVLLNGEWVSDPNPAAHNKRDGLIYCENNAPCPASRTADVVKAACTAVYGSALALIK